MRTYWFRLSFLNKTFNDVLVEKNIRLRTSALYKHQQNLAERYVGSVKDGIRTVMAYNNVLLHFVTGVMPWTTSAIPLITSRASTRLDLAMKFSLESNPTSVIRYRFTLPGTTMNVQKSGSLYPSMVLAVKPLHVKAAPVACSVMPTRISTIRFRTHTSFSLKPALLSSGMTVIFVISRLSQGGEPWSFHVRRRNFSQLCWHVHRSPNEQWRHKRKLFTIN
jgi:hypothetical protein